MFLPEHICVLRQMFLKEHLSHKYVCTIMYINSKCFRLARLRVGNFSLGEACEVAKGEIGRPQAFFLDQSRSYLISQEFGLE
jgi:hypothetical protein